MKSTISANNFQYLGALTNGEVWRFNFRDQINKIAPKPIPVSTYSNWLQRSSIPAYVPNMLVDLLKNRVKEVEDAYHLHSYGLDETAGEKTGEDGVKYTANLTALISRFLEENLSELGNGSVIYFNFISTEKDYTFEYVDEIAVDKIDPKTGKPERDANGKKIRITKIRDEPIEAKFDVNYFALSLHPSTGWKTYKISNSGDFLVKLLSLKDDLKASILKKALKYQSED